VRGHFANLWQIAGVFANDWQNTSRARPMVLPMFGKFGLFLPNIGKKKKRAADAARPPLVTRNSSLVTARRRPPPRRRAQPNWLL
jgi:hypothetical protein